MTTRQNSPLQAALYMAYPPIILGDVRNMNYTRAYRLIERDGHPAFAASMDYYNNASFTFTDSPENLTRWLTLSTSMVNVMLAPVKFTDGVIAVTMIHSCFNQLHEPDNHFRDSQFRHTPVPKHPDNYSVIGNVGDRFYGSLVENPTFVMVNSLEDGNPEVEDLVVPNIDEIIHEYIFGNGFTAEVNQSQDKDHFHLIRSKSKDLGRDTVKDVWDKYPNCFMIHPKLITFSTLGLVHEHGYDPSFLAHMFIQATIFERENERWPAFFEPESLKEKLKPIYPVLIYLWLLGNGLGFGVNATINNTVDLTFKNDRKFARHMRYLMRKFRSHGELESDDEYEDNLVAVGFGTREPMVRRGRRVNDA